MTTGKVVGQVVFSQRRIPISYQVCPDFFLFYETPGSIKLKQLMQKIRQNAHAEDYKEDVQSDEDGDGKGASDSDIEIIEPPSSVKEEIIEIGDDDYPMVEGITASGGNPGKKRAKYNQGKRDNKKMKNGTPIVTIDLT